MDVAVVGAGRVGTALAILLQRAGHVVTAVSGRAATAARAAEHLPGVPVVSAVDAAGRADLVLLAVPDDALGAVALELAEAGSMRRGAWAVHVSGAAGLEVLAPLLAAGVRRLAMHALQTVPDVEGAIERIPGSAVAITADDEEGAALGERLARDIGGLPFRLADERRPLYHAAAVFASNYLITAAGVAEALFREAGVPDPVAALLPLARASLDNVARLGPAGALTGPAVRADAGTVARNLEALRDAAPHAVPAYVELCRLALDLGERAGRLTPEGRAAVEEVLADWT
jgi:predicted short-subunit dehydrogenase-like oxidoreductase (DUF2520 family)